MSTVGVGTLLVDGTDLKALTGITVNSIELYAPGTRRGANDTVPGRRGQLGAPKVWDAYAFSAMITVSGGSGAEMSANLRAAATALAGDGGLVTLTRRLPTATDPFYVDHSAAGEYVGMTAFALLNPVTGRTELQFLNLDGAWYDGTAWLTP